MESLFSAVAIDRNINWTRENTAIAILVYTIRRVLDSGPSEKTKILDAIRTLDSALYAGGSIAGYTLSVGVDGDLDQIRRCLRRVPGGE